MVSVHFSFKMTPWFVILKEMHTDNCITFNSQYPRILTGVIKCLANRQTKSVTANSKKQQELEYLELGIVCQWDSKLHSDKVLASQITLHTLDGCMKMNFRKGNINVL